MAKKKLEEQVAEVSQEIVDKAAQLKEQLRKKRKTTPIKPEDFVSTGSTLLNLALSGRSTGGFVKGKVYRFVGDSGSGKAQPLDCKVLTPTGWSRMGDLQIGDKIVDPDGGIGKVKGLYPQGQKEVYKLRFSDGASTECCADHLWLVQTNNDRRRKKTRLVDTRWMMENLHQRIYLPEHIPVEFPHQTTPLLVHPYLLGVLIGDGCMRPGAGVTICSPDEEIIHRIQQYIPDECKLKHRGKIEWRVSVGKVGRKGKGGGGRIANPLTDALMEMGLWGKLSYQKFIPKQYLLASKENRMELLRGLMDTDGFIGKDKGNPTFTTSSKKLIKQVAFLVRSLGGMAIAGKVNKAPKYTYKGEIRYGRPSYGVTIGFPKGTHVFHLTRKKERASDKMSLRPRLVTSIDPIGVKTCQCIKVNTKRNLYFTDHFIPTHNTFLTLTCFAEAMHNKNFEHYRIIHDNPEDGALMDMSGYFGERVAKKIEAPRYSGKTPEFSNTTEEFYDNIDRALDEGKPFIYVLDSMDALDSSAALKKLSKNKSARASGGAEKGSFGDGKAIQNSTNLRRITRRIRKSGSIVIIISQTRDNIGFGSQFNPRVASGGKALKFFSTIEIWTSILNTIKKKVGVKDRKIGINVKLEVQKNRVSGRDWTVVVPILNSVGIDDIGGCIDFLVEEGHWKLSRKDDGGGKRLDANKGKIAAPEFDFEGGTKEKLIEKIEGEGRERELRLLVKKVFESIVDGCEVKRKVRYF